MANEYSLVPIDGNESLLDVVMGEKSIGQVGVVDGAWRYRLGSALPWSVDTFGSEFEASELVLVGNNLLEVGPKGVVVSNITVRK